MKGLGQLLRRRVADPVVAQLRQGITPEKLALSLALGVVLSAVPILGITALFCVAAAAALRLNQPAILAANYAATPVQVALYIPFFRAGAWLFGAPPVSFSLEQVRAELQAGIWPTVVRYWDANLRALGAWALVAPIAIFVLFAALRAVLRRLPIPGGPAERPVARASAALGVAPDAAPAPVAAVPVVDAPDGGEAGAASPARVPAAAATAAAE
jgi:uncharacterized protein (DUF2062 family)